MGNLFWEVFLLSFFSGGWEGGKPTETARARQIQHKAVVLVRRHLRARARHRRRRPCALGHSRFGVIRRVVLALVGGGRSASGSAEARPKEACERRAGGKGRRRSIVEWGREGGHMCY